MIDLHTHLHMLEIPVEQAVAQAKAAGVSHLITVSSEPSDLALVRAHAERFAEVFCTQGIHPHDAKHFSQDIGDQIRGQVHHPKFVAIGEIGLDFYYNHSTHEEQVAAFETQMDLAIELQKPVQIHTRDAEKETIEILKKYRGKVKGILHCFTGTGWLADQALDLGYDLSFSGVVTFRNAEELRKTLDRTPLDRIHVETDAPFLSPVPKRKKKNEPAFVMHTAALVAQLKNVSVEELRQQTYRNAKQMKLVFDYESGL